MLMHCCLILSFGNVFLSYSVKKLIFYIYCKRLEAFVCLDIALGLAILSYTKTFWFITKRYDIWVVWKYNCSQDPDSKSELCKIILTDIPIFVWITKFELCTKISLKSLGNHRNVFKVWKRYKMGKNDTFCIFWVLTRAKNERQLVLALIYSNLDRAHP